MVIDYSNLNFEILFSEFANFNSLPLRGYYGNCPCEECHSEKSGKHFFVYLMPAKEDGLRLIWGKCLHQSCRDELKKYYHNINLQWVKYLKNHKDIKYTYEDVFADIIRQKAQAEQAEILRKENERHVELFNKIKHNILPLELPLPIFSTPQEDMLHHLNMFSPHKNIFIGTRWDSDGHLYNLLDDAIPFPPPEFTSTFYFKDKCGRRSADNCDGRDYGVLEMDDKSSKASQFALLKAIEQTLNIPLLMALDSGGKSIHGWFRWTDLEPYLSLFKYMKYDWNVLTSRSQPVRLAGAWRKDKKQHQSIIYIKNN